MNQPLIGIINSETRDSIQDAKDSIAREHTEAAEAAGHDFLKRLNKIIEENTHRENIYYILAVVKNDREFWNQKNLTFMVMPKKPPELLSTICVSIDNKKGAVVWEWVLVADLPTLKDQKASTYSKEIVESHKNLSKKGGVLYYDF